ncbi:MAG: Smr/MutS family protein [Rhodobacteraceae bacterium]|nr:Smr/MutS family protein [Paracoccaceae bacterium]
MARRRKGLTPEERDLWARVVEQAKPLHRRAPAPAGPAQSVPMVSDLPPPPEPPPPIPAFRVGQAVPVARPHDLAPDLSAGLAAAPLRMDRKRFVQMSRGKLAPEARIDLHGLTLAEAHPRLTAFILRAHAHGARLVLVITGKGRDRDDGGPIPVRPGALRHQLPHWLSLPPLRGIVLQVSEAHLKHGGSGAFYVYLRRA